MKKYSTDYFEKKYKILAEKLLQKEGFSDAIKATRAELGLPENGFSSTPELAYFLIEKLSKDEQMSLTFIAFIEAYAHKHKIFITEENREEVIKAFLKEGYKKGKSMIAMMFELSKSIETHHSLFTKNPLFEENKYLSSLSKAVSKLMQKFWGVLLRMSMTKSCKT